VRTSARNIRRHSPGCAEAPLGGEIDAATESYRHDIHALFSELAAAAGAPDPALLANSCG
jgi:hypothetical protein